MREMIRMVLVITLLACVSGGLLAAVNSGTLETREKAVFVNETRPTLERIFAGSSNTLGEDKFKIQYEGKDCIFYVGAFDGEPTAIAFLAEGKGYGGTFYVLVGVDVESDDIIGIGMTKHGETPGFGAKAKEEPELLADKFNGRTLLSAYQLKGNGGEIDGISGATMTSKGVCGAVTSASTLYQELKPQILEQIEEIRPNLTTKA